MAEYKGRSGGLRVSIRYYKRMRRGKVYPATVRWAQNSGREGGPVTIRLLMGGAQVVPAEQPLDPANPRAQATFFVTPIAKGWLRGEHVEVLLGGKKLQEVATPAKVTSQRWTLLFLILSFLVPYYVVPFFTTSPFHWEPRDAKTGERLVDSKTKKPVTIADPDQKKAITPGYHLEAWLLYLQDRYCPPIPELFKEYVTLAEDEDGYETLVEKWTNGDLKSTKKYTVLTTKAPQSAGIYYDHIYTWRQEHRDIPFAFWSMVALLALTFLSFIWFQERRGRRETSSFALV